MSWTLVESQMRVSEKYFQVSFRWECSPGSIGLELLSRQRIGWKWGRILLLDAARMFFFCHICDSQLWVCRCMNGWCMNPQMGNICWITPGDVLSGWRSSDEHADSLKLHFLFVYFCFASFCSFFYIISPLFMETSGSCICHQQNVARWWKVYERGEESLEPGSDHIGYRSPLNTGE